MSSQHACPRCRSPLAASGQIPGCVILTCSNCRREWRQPTGKALFESSGPLALALYAAIFDKEPTKRAKQIAEGLLEDLPPEKVQEIVAEIELELKDPCQSVKDIHDAVASEDELRRCLQLILTNLRP